MVFHVKSLDPSGSSLSLEGSSAMSKASERDSHVCLYTGLFQEHVPREEWGPQQGQAHPYRHRGFTGPGKYVQFYLMHMLFLPF